MKFALITEGASEHRVIKHIITRYFRDQAPEINQIQPRLINDKQETTGGWNEVLKYCEREELKDILLENDYLIIQIDTDQSQTKPFSIAHDDAQGKPKPLEQLHEEVIGKLSDLIKAEVLEKHKSRIVFAICIHTIECWLLPSFYNNKHKTDTANCLKLLNMELDRQNIHIITATNKNKPNGIKSYDAILKNFKKKSDIDNAAQYNYGFKHFIRSLKAI